MSVTETTTSDVAGYVELPLTGGDRRLPEFRALAEPTDDGMRVDGSPLPAWHGRGLRVALAMKGGLSLAVWIGGAVAELDLLRRIRIYRHGDEPRALIYHIGHRADVAGNSLHIMTRARRYARLLASRGYDHVEFDVLAGASAGGLNGVLYATAQRAGVGFDTILKTWVETGSAWGLLQTGNPRAFDSVMRGDTYFWPQVASAIDEIARARTSCPALRAPQVVVDLSATLIDAVDSTDRTTSEGRAQFRFVGDDGDRLDRSVPERPTEPSSEAAEAAYAADVARIAYAARTTSSFPGMFEPALIYSGSHPLVSEHGWERPAATGSRRAVDAPDMRMVFNAHRADASTHPFRVVDGGLLDNIPIDRALNAVRNLPAEEHINRAIIYLDPSPREAAALFRRPTAYETARPTLIRTGPVGASRAEYEPQARASRNDVASRLVGTAIASLRKRGARESRDDEIEDVDLVRAAVSVVKARNELLAVRMDGSVPTGRRGREAIRAYALYRATSDLELLTPALMHPGEWLLGTDLPERAELAALDRLGMVRIEAAFRDAADRIQEDDSIRPHDEAANRYQCTLQGGQSLVDACLTTLSWIRAIEDTAFQEGVLDALDERIDAALPDPGDADERPGTTGRARRDLRQRLNTIMREARLRRDTAIFRVLVGMQDDIRGCSLSPDGARGVRADWHARDTASSADLRRSWEQLDSIVARLFQISDALDAITPAKPRWQRTPWSRIERGRRSEGFASQLPLIFGGNGIPQPISSVRFHRIGSDIQPAHPTEYRKLLEDQLLRGYRGALARPLDELDAVTVHNYLDERTLRSNAKLAGLRTANLAGFLSGDWRVNDWWWGRLDAAAGIIEFLDSLSAAKPKRDPGSGARLAPLVLPDLAVEPERAAEPEVEQAFRADAAYRGHATGLTIAEDRSRDIRKEATDRMLAEVHDALLHQAVTSKQPPVRLPDPAAALSLEPNDVRDALVRGTQGLDSLTDGYRTAIVSRTLRSASSALTRGGRLSSPGRFLHWILRPIGALAPALASPPRLVLLFAFLICGALLVWPLDGWSMPDGDDLNAMTITSFAISVALVLLVWGRLGSAIRAKRRRQARILEHTGTKVRTRAVIRSAEQRARRGRIWLFAASVVSGIVLVIVDVLFGMGTVFFWAAVVAFVALSESATRAFETVPKSLAPGESRIGTAVFLSVVALLVTIALTTGVARPAWAGQVWGYALWHSLGAALVGAAIAFTMLTYCFARPSAMLPPVLVVTATAAVAAFAVNLGSGALSDNLGSDAFVAPVPQIAEVLVVGWAAGTALWWAPWWRGRATEGTDAPEDTVADLDWDPVLGTARAAEPEPAPAGTGVAGPLLGSTVSSEPAGPAESPRVAPHAATTPAPATPAAAAVRSSRPRPRPRTSASRRTR